VNRSNGYKVFLLEYYDCCGWGQHLLDLLLGYPWYLDP
jgi:hypothetical protein